MKKGRGRRPIRTRRDRDGVGHETAYCVECGVHMGRREDGSLMCEYCEALKYGGVWERKIGEIEKGWID